MKKHLSTIIVVIIFICGLSIFLYPTISNLYNEYLNTQLISDYKDAYDSIKPEDKNRALEDARLYNETLGDPQKQKELGLKYENMLNLADNGIMGYIEIPKISVSLVINHSIEENVLQKGIGHVPESHLPIGGKSTHAVLAGHTGLPSAKLLTNIDHLKVGDDFYIHILDEVLRYSIDDISVVEPTEVSHLNVISGKDCVTLVTCTPYGVNSHRLLVRGVRVQSGSFDPDALFVSNDILHIDIEYVLTFSLIGLLIVFVAIRMLFKRRKKKKDEKEKEGNGENQEKNE